VSCTGRCVVFENFETVCEGIQKLGELAS